MTLNEKVERLSKQIYPCRVGKLTINDKIDVIMKASDPIKLISEYLDKRQYDLFKLINDGRSLTEASEELGYKNTSSVSQIMKSIKTKLESLLQDDEDIEEEIIKLCK